MERAAFSLVNYKFDKVYLNFENKISSEIEVDFTPSGLFTSNPSSVELNLLFSAFNHGRKQNPYIEIRCVALFQSDKPLTLEEIPVFFYSNSIAIIFPYIRSFISTVTLQANIIPPILLPTWNLTALGDMFKGNMIQQMQK